jgi:hypothetical protein
MTPSIGDLPGPKKARAAIPGRSDRSRLWDYTVAMSLIALIARCLMVLALVASGLPAMAQPAGPAEPETAAAASCHDDAGHVAADEPPPTDPADLGCCDGGDCTCTCLHHAPATLCLALAPATVHPHGPAALFSLRIAPGPALLPSLRPPIA